MLFIWGCPSFHFLIHNLNLNSSPKIMYSNLFLFNNASFHFLSYIFNVTFSDTLKYFNLFHFTTFYFHLFIYNLNITFSPTLTHSNIFLFNNAWFNPLWYVQIKILIGGVTCVSTCSGYFIHKTAFFLRTLRCNFLFLFLYFFSLFIFSISASLCFLNWSFLIVSINIRFQAYIIHPKNWMFVAWNQRIFGYALLHHHIKPQCNIYPD